MHSQLLCGHEGSRGARGRVGRGSGCGPVGVLVLGVELNSIYIGRTLSAKMAVKNYILLGGVIRQKDNTVMNTPSIPVIWWKGHVSMSFRSNKSALLLF